MLHLTGQHKRNRNYFWHNHYVYLTCHTHSNNNVMFELEWIQCVSACVRVSVWACVLQCTCVCMFIIVVLFLHSFIALVPHTPRSGELRTQKLKSHLMRTQSLNVLPLKPGVGQYMAIHATLTARDFFLAYFYLSSPFTCIFSKMSDFSCVGCG